MNAFSGPIVKMSFNMELLLLLNKKDTSCLHIDLSDDISYPLCKIGIRPGVCEKPALSHEAEGPVQYGWRMLVSGILTLTSNVSTPIQSCTIKKLTNQLLVLEWG